MYLRGVNGGVIEFRIGTYTGVSLSEGLRSDPIAESSAGAVGAALCVAGNALCKVIT